MSNIENYVASLKRLAPQARRLVLDSRCVSEGDVFVAVPGLHVDGRSYMEQAAAKAVAIVYEDDGVHYSLGIPTIAVPNLSEHLGTFASIFYRQPTEKLFGIGITGTNGKTTTSHWVSQLMTRLGQQCAAIGTIGAEMAGKHYESAALTTPDAASIQGLFRELLDDGAAAFAVEASSIGLEQGRLQATNFDVAVFTNLSRDHLDYHPNMAAYEAAKTILFDWPSIKAAVINIDDEVGVRLAERSVCRGLKTYVTTTKWMLSPVGTCGICAQNLRPAPDGMTFELVYEGQAYPLALRVFGEFNISNVLAVVGVALARGFAIEQIVAHLGELVSPPGRMQLVSHPHTALGVVDYSHTPDAVEKALQALRPAVMTRGGKLWVVIGAGGDRDSGKRPMMAAIAQKNADRVILTADNPRSEDPMEILRQMQSGIDLTGAHVDVIADRREAIQWAVNEANENDIILVAGKGHELYQEIQGVKHPFSDVVEIRNAQSNKVEPHGALMRVKYLAQLFPGAQFVGSDVSFTNVCTDTRQVTEGSLFFALRGDRFNGHDFVMQAMRLGASALVVDHFVNCPLPQIIVKDTKLALGASAAYWRGKKAITMIAVAGSNGKTTTTQMIASILRANYGDRAFATQGNLNNDIGVPLMLWRLRDYHEVAVIETGMNHPGEMAYLAGIVQPKVAIVTNAQREHQEFMQTVQATARENGEIFRKMMHAGTAVIPIDDDCKNIWLDMAQEAQVMTFGLAPQADVAGSMTSTDAGMTITVKTPRDALKAQMKVRGEHNLRNALGAIAVALALDLSPEAIVKGLEAFEPVKGRGAVLKLGGQTVIDDAYNANPDSMRASIEVLSTMSGPRLLVVGDMLELGAKSREYHEEIGVFAAMRGIDAMLATGSQMQHAVEKFKAANPDAYAHFEPDRKRFIERLLEIKDQYRTISLKASNSMRLDVALQALKDAAQSR